MKAEDHSLLTLSLLPRHPHGTSAGHAMLSKRGGFRAAPLTPHQGGPWGAQERAPDSSPHPQEFKGVGTEEGWLGAGRGRGGLLLRRTVLAGSAAAGAAGQRLIILSISAKQQKHKPLELLLCFLAGTHILMAVRPHHLR